MTFNPIELLPFDVPTLIHETRVGKYDVKILPGGGRLKNGGRSAGVHISISWTSDRSKQREGFDIAYNVRWYDSDFSISPLWGAK